MLSTSKLPALAADFPNLNSAPSLSPSGESFGELFRAAVGKVDGLQSAADSRIGSLLDGSSNADVGNVMASVEKADVAFQLMMQVRNKVVSAYQEIEKMQF